MAKMTYESRIELAKQKIREKPEKALQAIGKFLVKEIKLATPKGFGTRKITRADGTVVTVKPGRLRSSFSYWYRKKEGDLQVGSKAFYASFFELGTSKQSKTPFFLPTVEKNVGVIQEMIAEALKELTNEQ